MVLQRAPQHAAVYGYVVGGPGCTGPKCTVAVTVAPAAAPFGSQSTPKYTVEASVTAVAGRNYSHWKALLQAAPAGGNYTVSAACPLCGKGDTNATTIVDATFGVSLLEQRCSFPSEPRKRFCAAPLACPCIGAASHPSLPRSAPPHAVAVAAGPGCMVLLGAIEHVVRMSFSRPS